MDALSDEVSQIRKLVTTGAAAAATADSLQAVLVSALQCQCLSLSLLHFMTRGRGGGQR